MKSLAFLLILIVFNISLVISSPLQVDNPLREKQERIIKTDVILNVSGIVTDGVAIFELSVLNDSKAGFYALKREFSDGRFESVELSKIIVNSNKLPVDYHFEDQNVPKEDFTYVLLRIVPKTREFEVLKRWEYCHAKEEICPADYLVLK